MYLQITTKCSMRCSHCCYSCGPTSGEFMSRKTFMLACKLAWEHGDGIFLGGGEPTLHPRFWEFLGLALKYTDGEDQTLGVITNGSRTEDALALARLAKRGSIYAGLSQDGWHESIDDKVVKAFTKPSPAYGNEHRGTDDLREIRGCSEPYAQGRAKDWGKDGCCCPEIIVVPDGRIYACGCLTAQLGAVECPKIGEKWWSEHECVKQTEGVEA